MQWCRSKVHIKDPGGAVCRHIQAHASSCSESGVAGGTIRQSFCSALQSELAEFYHLMAVLQEQSLREAPRPDNLSSGFLLAPAQSAAWFNTATTVYMMATPGAP